MARGNKRPSGPPIVRSPSEFVKGLESLSYEAVMLASALILRDKRSHFVKYPGEQWGTPQIAHDVIRLKSRLLLSFFGTGRKSADDMLFLDFPISGWVPIRDRTTRNRFHRFKSKVNQWTVHLSWKRTSEPEYTRADRELMEKVAEDLLSQVEYFVEACLATGLKLGKHGIAHYDNLKRLRRLISRTARTPEDNGQLITEPIDLETRM
jgi:hypothetical protein